MNISNQCLNKKLHNEVDKALSNLCNDIDEYDYYIFYKYVIQKYNLYLFYDPYKDEYYISEEWALV